jgi:predicted GIY-YIG superfamily endonuclease
VKSYLLISELYFRETLWLLGPKNGSSGLEQLPLNKRLASKPVLADEGLAKARERVRVQLSLVQYFSDRNASIALPLRKAAAISGRDERRSEVNRVIAQLEPKAKQFPSGSFLNFLGTLALANEENERAFKFYYAGVTEDPEHLPIYESLSYSMWRLNGDSRTARRYAANGFGLVQDLSLRWRRQREQSAATLTELRARNASIEPYAREVSAFYAMAEPSVTGYLNVMFERLGSSLAYYSALELTDREQAKRIIKDVVERRPENAKDADYVDTQGFVTLRFASTLDEVDEAIRTFQAAKKLADQKEQIDLIDLHLDTAQKIRQQSSRG